IEPRSMHLIASRFGHGIYDASGRATILCREGTVTDLIFLDRIDAVSKTKAGTALCLLEEGLGFFHTIHHIVVVQAGNAPKAEQTESAIIAGSRSREREAVPTPAAHREIHHVFEIDHGADVGLGGLHGRRSLRDRDLGCSGSHLHLQINYSTL